jgi:cytochrome c oxidase subunit 4
MEHDQVAEPTGHPGPRQYVMVAAVLAVATAMEVAWYYLSVPHALFVGLLLVLAVLKFALVALWFMHLRFDNKIFKRLFVMGLLLALSVYLIVLTIFGALKYPLLLGFSAILIMIVAIALYGFLRGRRSAQVL